MDPKIEIFARNLEVTDRIKDYVTKKVSKLDRFLTNIEDTRIDLVFEKSARSAADRQVAQITLRGKVLPVGGIREKVLAAHRSGLKMVLMPERNKKDLNEIPKKVRDDMQIVFVSHMDQVLELALEPAAEKKVTRTAKKKTSTKEDSTKEA